MIKKKIFFPWILIAFVSVIFAGCEKTPVSGDDLLGVWVNESKSDTIWFADQNNFFHSSKDFAYSQYEYSVSEDSITVQYVGFLKIYVQPSIHYIELKGDELMIDFSDELCFGFPKEKMYYKRIQKLVLE
jgi:hypothetical protein